MKNNLLNQWFLYVIAILHTPWTLFRVFIALILLADEWAGNTITKLIKTIDRELKEERISELEHELKKDENEA